MNNPLFYTPEEAAQTLRAFGAEGQTAAAISTQAQNDPSALGYPVSVSGTRVRIPRWSFDRFWGIDKLKEKERKSS